MPVLQKQLDCDASLALPVVEGVFAQAAGTGFERVQDVVEILQGTVMLTVQELFEKVDSVWQVIQVAYVLNMIAQALVHRIHLILHDGLNDLLAFLNVVEELVNILGDGSSVERMTHLVGLQYRVVWDLDRVLSRVCIKAHVVLRQGEPLLEAFNCHRIFVQEVFANDGVYILQTRAFEVLVHP